MKYARVYALFLMSVFNTSYGQTQTAGKKIIINSEAKYAITSHGSTTSVRTIRQDRKGNIWLVSTEGIIRYDGKSFTNLTSKFGSLLSIQVFIITMGNLFNIIQPGRGLLVTPFLKFMKIKAALFGLALEVEQAVMMENPFEILK